MMIHDNDDCLKMVVDGSCLLILMMVADTYETDPSPLILNVTLSLPPLSLWGINFLAGWD